MNPQDMIYYAFDTHNKLRYNLDSILIPCIY